VVMVANQKMHGVNLGGWLVLEPWLTPSLFDGVQAEDEHSWCVELGTARHARLDHHRKTFITDDDFKVMAEQGIDAVRIPVGYWIFADTEPYVGGIKYLDQAVHAAATRNIKVLIDLHGAPGSQNGWDHSGQRGAITWHLNPSYVSQTVDVLGKLAERYGDEPKVWGIEVLNEPHWDIPKDVLATFYEAAYKEIHGKAPRLAVVISDSFRPWLWADVLSGPEFDKVVLDSHLYQCFSAEDQALDITGHIKKAQTEWRETINEVQQTRPMIIGEWSIALENYQSVTDKQLYAAAQLDVFAQAAGEFYWTYKKEVKDDWHWAYAKAVI
jgi:glucan 1,3-beta-glucosidase